MDMVVYGRVLKAGLRQIPTSFHNVEIANAACNSCNNNSSEVLMK